MDSSGIVRLATAADAPALARLCVEHAAFEGAAALPPELAERLGAALGAESPRVWSLVVDQEGELLGYAAYSPVFSFWDGVEYLHLDCLFVAETHRGGGWGRQLLGAVRRLATDLGMVEVQWQTPDWNAAAIRFYDRTGAQSRPKLRYSLVVPPRSGNPRPQ